MKMGKEATDVVEGTGTGLGDWMEVADRVTRGTKVQISTTMTFADGELFFDIEGTEGADGFSGTYTITGGTGRFEGATGSGSNTATSNPDGSFTQGLRSTDRPYCSRQLDLVNG